LIRRGAISAATTRADGVAWVVDVLERAGVEAPRREARLALCAASGLSASSLLSSPGATLGVSTAKRLEEFADRRAAGEPLSRIAARREFWTQTLAISLDVLDPRPETETIVESALALFAGRRGEALRILDLGVGSGALLCALLSEFRAAWGIGVDSSPAAASVARGNVEACGLSGRAEIQVGDWADGVEGPFDLIVSNPPYIPSAEIAVLPREVRDFDPPLALDGGADGLEAYRAIIPSSARLISPNGWLIVEIGSGQSACILAMAARMGFVEIGVHRDLAGVERVVSARAAPTSNPEGRGACHERCLSDH
jgi:release factor glutamine methyltransferase